MKRMPALAIALSFLTAFAAFAADDPDPYLWLEEVEGQKALAWAKEQNQKTTADLEKVKQYKPIYDRTLQILDSKERIPSPSLTGDMVYNFWQDKDHARGIWRRATLGFVPDARAAVGDRASTSTPWSRRTACRGSWKGANCLPPEHRLCLVSLARGGSDAAVVRGVRRRHQEVRGGRLLAARGEVERLVARREHALGRHRLRRRAR